MPIPSCRAEPPEVPAVPSIVGKAAEGCSGIHLSTISLADERAARWTPGPIRGDKETREFLA